MTSTIVARAVGGFERGQVEGPIGGHHHNTYAVRLDPASAVAGEFGRVKLREPKADIVWFDQRCFASEEKLAKKLAEFSVPRIPKVVRLSRRLEVFGFIEGQALGAKSGPGDPLEKLHVEQLLELFHALVGVDIRSLWKLKRVCDARRITDGNDSDEFFRRLVEFTEKSVRGAHATEFGLLFERLGIPDDLLTELPGRIGPLSPRPYRLLHGDLHRDNMIVDLNGDLWTIDWELARIGDPLYELATHLHLMAYPEAQAELVRAGWEAVMKEVLPDALNGWEEDLRRYQTYKRVQSVFTDVIRGAASTLPARDEPVPRRTVEAAAVTVARVLEAAEKEPGMPPAPDAGEVADVLTEWAATQRR